MKCACKSVVVEFNLWYVWLYVCYYIIRNNVWYFDIHFLFVLPVYIYIYIYIFTVNTKKIFIRSKSAFASTSAVWEWGYADITEQLPQLTHDRASKVEATLRECGREGSSKGDQNKAPPRPPHPSATCW